MENIFQLAYISQASEGICYSDIQNILDSAREHNRKNDLTGLLVYKDDHFLQILEGEQKKVLETFGKIVKDRRCHHISVLVESFSAGRIFNRWPLAFHDADIDPQMNKLMGDLFKAAWGHCKQEKKLVLKILKSFRQGCCHFQEA